MENLALISNKKLGFTMADQRSRSQSDIHLLGYLPAFTMADRRSSRPHILGCALAFTMAEILISLTIIGIIAAITLPSLRANINETTWNTQRKALYSRMSQAIAMMPSLNGYGIGATDEETASKAAEAFITDGLSKVFKITNICDNSNLKKCGFPDKFTKMGTNSKKETPKTIVELNSFFNASTNSVNYSQINTNSAVFETANGESILTFYNPNCSYTYGVNGKNGLQNLMQPTMCANFIYDLNGRKGPNKVGKDIGFITAFYPADSQIVAPNPAGDLMLTDDGAHPKPSIGYGNASCRKKYGEDAKMANIEELESLFINNIITRNSYMSSSLGADSRVYYIEGVSGSVGISTMFYITYNNITHRYVFCVKR